MGATLQEFVRGLTGQVTREDAKKLAKLHGHPWKKVLKAMKRRARVTMPTPGISGNAVRESLADVYADSGRRPADEWGADAP